MSLTQGSDFAMKLSLSEHNYTAWNKRAGAFLIAKKMAKYVLETRSFVASGKAELSEEDKENLSQAMGMLELAIGTEQSFLIDEFKEKNKGDDSKQNDPWELWAFLKTELSGKSEAREAFLRKELSGMLFDKPDEAVRKVKNSQNEMKSIGGTPFTNAELKIALLDSLENSDSYQTLTQLLRFDAGNQILRPLLESPEGGTEEIVFAQS